MNKKINKVYQFKIELLEISPPIWRRILVPEKYTFWDLHVAIQDAMGWFDCHLHQFELVNPSTGEMSTIGIPFDDSSDGDTDILPGWEHKIAKWFLNDNNQAKYTYDFGDNWEHLIELEKILDADEKVIYPVCADGKRACPPEDCGSVPGYEDLCEIMKDKNHEDYEEMFDWLGEKYDPEYFNVNEIRFDDPRKRLKNVI